jgi:sugar/nucleoside kinase (ribokinase family)
MTAPIAPPMGDMTAIGCFSYLASVYTLHVEQFPAINYGADVIATDRFLAGDGPLAAGTSCALGHRAILCSNHVADDPDGRDVLNRLHRWGVLLAPNTVRAARTRTNVVVCDQAGNRTWFSSLRGIDTELAGIDLTVFVAADTAYIDCYEVLGTAAQPAVAAALDAGADTFINLGGSPPPSWLTTATRQRRVAVVQTNAGEHDSRDAARTLDALDGLGIADISVVTMGRHGAMARTRSQVTVTAPAVPVKVRQIQGAGAAFSAALIHARLLGQTLPECLRFACAAGSAWCSRASADHPPGIGDIRALLAR